jgi:adenosylhomocysteine nucleosidase
VTAAPVAEPAPVSLAPAASPSAAVAGRGGPTALIGAMPEELERLRSVAEAVRFEQHGPFELIRARLEGTSVVMATCGIGKVNAAALAQTVALAGVSRVIVTGVAGAVDPELRVGDLIVSRDAVQHDVDVTGLGYDAGQVPGEPRVWAADPALREAALEAAEAVARRDGVRALLGRVATGDAFIHDPAVRAQLRERFDAGCAEMEGAAVAQVCARWGLPWVVVRSVSDSADGSAELDFRAFTPVAAERAVAVVLGILRCQRP